MLESKRTKKFNILSLDGGGSKGIFSLGVLREVEALLGGEPLSESFDVIYGTSTGAIIAASLGLGMSVDEVKMHYDNCIPNVMRRFRAKTRSAQLRETLTSVFGDQTFESFKTDVGIVASNFHTLKPTVFKSNVGMAHGSKETFVPGFGASISSAVAASCSAYPYFTLQEVATKNQGKMLLGDGGFVANNPAFFALLDGLKAFKIPTHEIGLVSVGVGRYPEVRKFRTLWDTYHHFFSRNLLDKLFHFNSNTLNIVFDLYCKDIASVRIDSEFSDPALATSLFESNPEKLERLFVQGRDTYRSMETHVREVLGK